jgi:hypothetical protein
MTRRTPPRILAGDPGAVADRMDRTAHEASVSTAVAETMRKATISEM